MCWKNSTNLMKFLAKGPQTGSIPEKTLWHYIWSQIFLCAINAKSRVFMRKRPSASWWPYWQWQWLTIKVCFRGGKNLPTFHLVTQVCYLWYNTNMLHLEMQLCSKSSTVKHLWQSQGPGSPVTSLTAANNKRLLLEAAKTSRTIWGRFKNNQLRLRLCDGWMLSL